MKDLFLCPKYYLSGCILNAKLLCKHQGEFECWKPIYKKIIQNLKFFPPPDHIFHPLSTDQGGHILVISFAFLCITGLDIWPRDKWVTIVISITLIFADNHHQCLASGRFIPECIIFWKAFSVMHTAKPAKTKNMIWIEGIFTKKVEPKPEQFEKWQTC